MTTRKTDTTRQKTRNLRESDLAEELMGRNSLQGDDQANVRNERQVQPDVRQEADDVVESFRKRDKHYRARTDLNKGATRSHDDERDDGPDQT